MNLQCKVCGEKAAGYHFGAFTCEGCKSFFGRCCNNAAIVGECRNNKRCVINKINRTSCKACRLEKCLAIGMSKNGSRYGRRSNWFKQYFRENLQEDVQRSNSPSNSPDYTYYRITNYTEDNDDSYLHHYHPSFRSSKDYKFLVEKTLLSQNFSRPLDLSSTGNARRPNDSDTTAVKFVPLEKFASKKDDINRNDDKDDIPLDLSAK